MAGLFACLVSGHGRVPAGRSVAERLRRITPRAALLGVLAAVGITFIAADFAFRIYTRPLVGIAAARVPAAGVLCEASGFRWRLPGGFLAILFGSADRLGHDAFRACDWFGSVTMSPDATERTRSALRNVENVKLIAPTFVGGELWTAARGESKNLVLLYLTVSVPMGVINVIGSLQNIESAEAGGDRVPHGAVAGG